MNLIIVPYIGFDDINFSMSFEKTIEYLKNNNIKYHTEHWDNKGCSPEVAWDVIHMGNDVSLYFAKGKMFKMYFENAFKGCLENGITLGMTIDEAVKIDNLLVYDDFEEEYMSEFGYWVEDDPVTHKIISISVFIKELENDDLFFSYEWCEKDTAI